MHTPNKSAEWVSQPPQAVLSDRFALKAGHVAICFGFGVLFMYLNYIPLFHTEIWRHVALGNWMIENQTIPNSNPLVSLADGMDYVPTA